MSFMSLKGTRFSFIRDSQLLLFTQEKTSKGQVNPFLRASW